MSKRLIAVIALCFFIAACGYKATKETKTAVVSGCEIFKIELEGENYPIFLAKCKDTATVTYNTGGKSNSRVTTVTAVEKESQDLGKLLAEVEKKNAALKKLTPDERKLLSLE
jgi:hypothetical protein